MNNQITADTQAEINEHVLKRHAYLQGEIDKMTPFQLKVAQDRFTKAMDGASSVLNRKLPRILTNYKPKHLNIGIYFASTEEMRDASPIRNPHRVDVPAGIASVNRNCILIHNHLLLAPVEVIKNIVTHELLHHFFAQHKPNIDDFEGEDDLKEDGYIEGTYKEEQWVRAIEKQVTGRHVRLLEAWEAAIELEGANWRSAYYRLKRFKE